MVPCDMSKRPSKSQQAADHDSTLTDRLKPAYGIQFHVLFEGRLKPVWKVCVFKIDKNKSTFDNSTMQVKKIKSDHFSYTTSAEYWVP